MKFDLSLVLIQRSWQAISGILTIFFLTHFLTLEQQGWYFSFLSLAALYTLFDLGLSVVVIQLSAHLFIDLSWSSMATASSADQLRSLVSQSAKLYLLLALLFCLIMVPSGLVFFSDKAVATLVQFNWKLAWICLVLVTAANLLLLPFIAIVEGSGNIAEAYSVRLIQALAGSLGCWTVLMVGGSIWAAAMIPSMGLIVGLAWLLRFRLTLLKYAGCCVDKGINWKHDIWPLQWRIGLSWISGYLLTQIYTPILFYFNSSESAGQMGLSLSIANMVSLLAQSWIARSIPAMAQAAGKSNWIKLDEIFNKSFIASVLIFGFGVLAIGILYFLFSKTIYVNRLLPFWSLLGLLAIVFINHLIAALAAQLRSFRREPLVWVSLLAAIGIVPAAIWGASHNSEAGLIKTTLFIQLIFMLPASILIWKKCNKEWKVSHA